MAISFTCPNCDEQLTAGESRIGQRTRCPGCREPLTVPERSPRRWGLCQTLRLVLWALCAIWQGAGLLMLWSLLAGANGAVQEASIAASIGASLLAGYAGARAADQLLQMFGGDH